jgi:hypothetical protein
VVSNLMVSNPTVKRLERIRSSLRAACWHSEDSGDREGVRVSVLHAVSGLKAQASKADEKAVLAMLGEVEAARRARDDDAKLLAAIGGMEGWV